MDGFGFPNDNVNNDFFDKFFDCLDFPMESFEGNTSGDDYIAEFQSLGPLPSDSLLGLASNFQGYTNDGSSKIPTNLSVSGNETPQQLHAANIVKGMPSRIIPHQTNSSDGIDSSVLHTSSPVSVLQSSSSGTKEESQLFSINPAYNLRERPCPPSTFNPLRMTASSAWEISHPSTGSGSFLNVADSSESDLKKIPQSTKGKRKKRKKKNLSLLSGSTEQKKILSETWVVAKKCAHCLATRTPQWREGPLGRKTLCNACGVRYRSGRLYPEYRPAASPTFVPSLHSNSHKKVIEMRRSSSEEATPAVEAAESPPPEFVPMSDYLYDCIFEEGGGNFPKRNDS